MQCYQGGEPWQILKFLYNHKWMTFILKLEKYLSYFVNTDGSC